MSKSNEIGKPEIPVYNKLIEVPIGATVKMNVLSYDEEFISLSDLGVSALIKPAQPSERKDSHSPATFQYDRQVYMKKGYVNEEITRFEDEGVMRSCRIGQIIVEPIQYNPTENKLRVLNNIIVEVEFVGSDDNKTRTLKKSMQTHYLLEQCLIVELELHQQYMMIQNVAHTLLCLTLCFKAHYNHL